MSTSLTTVKEMLVQRQWRITVKSNDQDVPIDYSEPFAGNAYEAKDRAYLLWARTSYVVNGKLNRDVYTALEVWDEASHKYRMVKEKRGALPRKADAPK